DGGKRPESDCSLKPRACLSCSGFASVRTQEHAKAFWIMFGRPFPAVDVVGLRPRLAIDSERRDHRRRKHSPGRVPGSRVHDMAIDLAFRPEEFLITSGGGHRFILQRYLRHSFLFILGIPNS